MVSIGPFHFVFYNNCPISCVLIGWFLSSITGQMDKIWKLGLARAALCKWATCTRQTCLSKTLFIPGIWPVSGLVIVKNKLTSVFYASVLPSKTNFVITLSKFACQVPMLPAARGSTATMLWHNLSPTRGQTHKKLTSIC